MCSSDLGATGLSVMRVGVVAAIAAALLWRSRSLVRELLLRVSRPEIVQLRLLALLLLALTALSPRITHYDLLILLPVLAILAPLPNNRTLAAWCIVIPWLFRCALLVAHQDPFKSSLADNHGLDYNTLWNFYLFATWCAIAI